MSSIDKVAFADVFCNNDGTLKKPNYNNYISKDKSITLKDIIYCAFTNKRNFFLPIQYFVNLNFSSNINNITAEQFDLIQYLQDLLNRCVNIAFNNSTTILENNSIVKNLIVNNNLNSENLQCFNIRSNDIKSSNITTKSINTKKLLLNNKSLNHFNYIYINNFSLPIDSNEYLFSEFNLIPIGKVYITVNPTFKVFIYDVDDVLLFYYHNQTTKIIFMYDIMYNINYYKIKII